MLGAAATGAYPAPPPRNQLNSFAGLWHASGDTLPPDEPGPFNESFVLYQVRKRISFAMPFYTQNDHHFTKTGSGQTQGKHSKTDRACVYQNPHDGTITGVNYSGELCKQFGYIPPSVPELFEMEGTEITEDQHGAVVGTGHIKLTQKFVGDGGTCSVSDLHKKTAETSAIRVS